MEDKSPMSGMNKLVPDQMSIAQLAQRRKQAIFTFQTNPEDAIQLYPELENDLVNFYATGANPYLNPNTGMPIKNMETDFEHWEVAHAWAVARTNSQI